MKAFWTIVKMANPVFTIVSVFLPIGALVYALNSGSLRVLDFVHIMFGAVWTGIDIFMGFVLGPVLGKSDPATKVAMFRRLTPKMTFFMPVVATATIMTGISLAQTIGFPLTTPRVLAAFIIVGILTVQGFGILLPNEIRIFRQLLSQTPDTEKISRLGMLNAKLGGVQGVLQVATIFIMATLRF